MTLMQRPDKSEQKERVRTETVTLRIEQDSVDDLRKESKQKTQDIHVLINKILRDYITWQKPSKIGGNIPFSKGLLFRIFDNISEELMDKIAQDYVKYELKDQLLILGRQYNLQSYLDAVCSWCEACGFPYRYDETNDADVYTIRFDLGEKWSRFFGKFVHVIAEHFKVKNLKQEVINGTVILKIQR
jgi:hypothetical protein